MGIRVGIDTGGTFTDMIGVDEDTNEITVTKRPSTPRHPERGVFDALAGSGVPIDDITFLILGTTMAMNALHERAGARVNLPHHEEIRGRTFHPAHQPPAPLLDYWIPKHGYTFPEISIARTNS